MLLNQRLRVAACVTGSILSGGALGLVLWILLVLGIGRLVWAAPLLIHVSLDFGGPALGTACIVALLCAGSLVSHVGLWSVSAPVAMMAFWKISPVEQSVPVDWASLAAICGALSALIFFVWLRPGPARPPLARSRFGERAATPSR